jgi:hypothetical protein
MHYPAKIDKVTSMAASGDDIDVRLFAEIRTMNETVLF